MACKLFSALGQSTAHLPTKRLQNDWCARLCVDEV